MDNCCLRVCVFFFFNRTNKNATSEEVKCRLVCIKLKDLSKLNVMHVYHTSSIHLGSFALLCLFPSLLNIRMAEDEECVAGIHSELLKRSQKKEGE